MDTKQTIKAIASKQGFTFCQISKAEELTTDAQHLEQWLNNSYHAQMGYMENHFDLRIDPRKLVPGAKSVICLAHNYYPQEQQIAGVPKIAKYAYGKDYHKIIRKKMKWMMSDIREQIGEINGRAFVDSAPIMERVWAKKSGIGWVGKHSLIINKNQGSFFFLSFIISDLELEPDSPTTDHCGTCTACIDACPTDAIVEPYILDANKCISYLTIELKDSIDSSLKGKLNDWMFGCDICQDVCPWNKFSSPHTEEKFNRPAEQLNMNHREWEEITETVFDEIFIGSPLKRAGYSKLKNTLG